MTIFGANRAKLSNHRVRRLVDRRQSPSMGHMRAAALLFLGTLLLGHLLNLEGARAFEVGSEQDGARASDSVQEIAMLDDDGQLSATGFRTLANLVLAGIDREYPNKPSNTLEGEQDVRSPRELFPAFYGCFDWHSSVHGHWVLVRLLKLQPDHPMADEIRETLDRHLNEPAIRGELAFFMTSSNRSFERMYGWAWYLRLTMELHTWDDEQGQRWRDALRPLEILLVERTHEYLDKLQFPIRTGVHPNTAFAMGQILDYARAVNRPDLAELIKRRAEDYFLSDRDYPDRYEPSGEDFFSAGLCEADLMRRVMSEEDFARWLDLFLPSLGRAETSPMWTPVDVSDVTDGKIVHLAGLDLSRAWCLRGIADGLPGGDARREELEVLAQAHWEKGLEYVSSGHYEGEHWLGTFALYTLSRVATSGDSVMR